MKGNAVLIAFFAMLLALFASGEASFAQKLFKYRDANGVWVYTDRQPSSEQNYEESELERSFEPAEVRLYQQGTAQGIALIARNTYFAPVQIAFQLTRTDNVAEELQRDGMITLLPRSEMQLMVVGKADVSAAMAFDSEFRFLPGDPEAQHLPDQPYRLPFALASTFPVSQAFPEVTTHRDPASQHAIDFVMPIGTAVYAARAGTVIEVASNFFEAGLDPSVDGPRANLVRVLHDDGTMSLYGHLNRSSIRAVPGEHVARGQYLADSGNTGFSTGPHLHFVVQRNRGGAMVSIPVEFAGAAGSTVTVRSGSRVTAY